MIQKFAGALFIVIPLIWLVLYFYSKSSGAKGAKDRTELMRVVTNLPVGPKKAVSVVNIAGQYLVLGIASENISFLTRIEDAQAVEKLEESSKGNVQNGLKKVLNLKGALSATRLTKALKAKGNGIL
jgi:flagellar biosynthetic protein FliO